MHQSIFFIPFAFNGIALNYFYEQLLGMLCFTNHYICVKYMDPPKFKMFCYHLRSKWTELFSHMVVIIAFGGVKPPAKFCFHI